MKIVFYSSPSCPHCHRAREFMLKEGLAFIEKDVNDPANYQEYAKLGVQGVPVFVIGEERIVGFSPQQLLLKYPYLLPLCPSCGKRMKLPKGKGKLRVRCPHCHHAFEMES